MWKIKYRGNFFVLKKHLDSRQDRAFSVELEALTSKHLSSPHIVKFMGFTSNDSSGVTGLVSEYCVRRDLRYFLRRHLGWSWEGKLKWAAQICHGQIQFQLHEQVSLIEVRRGVIGDSCSEQQNCLQSTVRGRDEIPTGFHLTGSPM